MATYEHDNEPKPPMRKTVVPGVGIELEGVGMLSIDTELHELIDPIGEVSNEVDAAHGIYRYKQVGLVYSYYCEFRCHLGAGSGDTWAPVPETLGPPFRTTWAPIPEHLGTRSGRPGHRFRGTWAPIPEHLGTPPRGTSAAGLTSERRLAV